MNPRTGEILGADIMLEFKSLSFFINLSKLIGNNKSYDGIEIPSFIHDCNHPVCNTLESGQVENIFGGLALESLGSTKTERDKMSKQYLTYLILHEIGHTLGLNHNMKSSQLHSLNDIHNLELTSKVGLIGSVMDYPSINIALEKSKQGLYYTTRPGPYDLWAIKYAYQKGRSEKETKSLLAKSTKHELMFGNDSDDMRFPGRAIDPRVNVMDLSSDAIAYSVDRLKLTKLIGDNFLKNLNEEGISYHKHRVLYNILLSMQRIQANTISRYIGGVYVERAFIGQEGGTQPFTPVPLEKQKEAMRALDEYVFSPDAFTFPNEIYNYLQLQRRGFGFFRVNEDPKIHQAVLSNQKTILSHLLHKNTLQRIIDSELYGNAYKLSDFMSDINNVIFKKDIYENVNSFRQNLQIEYTKILIKMLTGEKSEMFLPTIKSTILSNLMRVKKMALNSGGDKSTQAHKSHLVLLIENALEEVK